MFLEKFKIFLYQAVPQYPDIRIQILTVIGIGISEMYVLYFVMLVKSETNRSRIQDESKKF